MTQFARIETKQCPMFEDACAARVAEWVGGFYCQPFDAVSLVEKQCGRYVRGKHAGKLRGWATIRVVTEGGWLKLGPGQGHGRVVRPGTVLSVTIADFNGKQYLTAGSAA